MAKKVKAVKTAVVAVKAPVVEVVAPVVEVAQVLTKRNRVPTTVTLVSTGKTPRDRANHTKLAWEVVAKALPATAKALVEALEAAEFDATTKAKLVSFEAYISYMIRRKALAPEAE